MATVTTRSEPRNIAAPTALDPAKLKPIKWFAALGAVWLGTILFSIVRWISSGNAHRVGNGPTEVPSYMFWAARIHEVLFIVLAVAAVYGWVYRPWKRERRLTFDGTMVLAFPTCWLLLDTFCNYSKPIFLYNTVNFNLGCPQCFLPGWQSNNTNMVDGLWAFFWYSGVAFGCVLFLNAAMRWYRSRWPERSRASLILFAFGCAFAFDVVTELFWNRLGLYVYTLVPSPGSIGSKFVLFYGHYYQIPLLEIIFAAVIYTAWGCIRFFKNDKGQTIAERGLDQMKFGKVRGPVRLLATIGILNLAFAVLYGIPTNIMAQHFNYFPEDIVKRSYFTSSYCGPGTSYACPDPRLPNWTSPNQARVTPEGNFIAPKGVPVQVRGGS